MLRGARPKRMLTSTGSNYPRPQTKRVPKFLDPGFFVVRILTALIGTLFMYVDCLVMLHSYHLIIHVFPEAADPLSAEALRQELGAAVGDVTFILTHNYVYWY